MVRKKETGLERSERAPGSYHVPLKESSYLRLRSRTFAISGTVSEPLAHHAMNGLIGSVLIVNAKRDPVVIPEVKFRQITVQMFLAAMLVALHAALEDRIIAFNR